MFVVHPHRMRVSCALQGAAALTSCACGRAHQHEDAGRASHALTHNRPGASHQCTSQHMSQVLELIVANFQQVRWHEHCSRWKVRVQSNFHGAWYKVVPKYTFVYWLFRIIFCLSLGCPALETSLRMTVTELIFIGG